jgi:hypothetical protein
MNAVEIENADVPKLSVTKHIKGADGVWHPIILDPMGDAGREAEAVQWLDEQEAERQALIEIGASVGF